MKHDIVDNSSANTSDVKHIRSCINEREIPHEAPRGLRRGTSASENNLVRAYISDCLGETVIVFVAELLEDATVRKG
jgi:hypothetical protein